MTPYPDTLVLNRNFVAVHIAGRQKIMSLIYTGEAVALDENLTQYNFKDWVELSAMMADSHPSGFVNTVTMKIAVPEIVRLMKYDRMPKRDVKLTRNNLYQQYKKKCCYCAKHVSSFEATWDHVTPRSKGGVTSWTNLVLSCKSCNARKADKTPEEAGMKLLVQPSRPEWKGARTLVVMAPVPIPKSWQSILDECFWNSELED